MENVNGLRKCFVLDRQGNRLLPITHVNLVPLGDDELQAMLDQVYTK